jgi:acyl-coenzyme A synthetase/AMP-(fatty) acid ligase/acyl carrier protein
LHHLWTSLLYGATLLPFDPRLAGGEPLVRWLQAARVTLYHSVPLVFRQMIAALTGEERFPDLRAIILSGAPMSAADLTLYQRHVASHAVLLHAMGTTETGWVRRYFMDARTRVTTPAVPLGYPLPDTTVLLLDERGVATDSGVGEIAVRSRYLASGYWRHPELTAARFLAAPDGGEDRVYRTGDLGRLEADGCLTHLGRQDFQVKVRGFRVELGEIERALLGHPGVKEVAVVGRPGPTGETQLVAYVVPAGDAAFTVTGLRSMLTRTLPDHMVPSAFVSLPALPCTPNGKLDYTALPAPERRRPELTARYVAPETELERRITALWQEILNLDTVGMHDNFFDLGGDSSMLTRVRSRLESILELEIPITELFQHPTIDALVRHLARSGPVPGDRRTADPVGALLDGRQRLAQLSASRQRIRGLEP